MRSKPRRRSSPRCRSAARSTPRKWRPRSRSWRRRRRRRSTGRRSSSTAAGSSTETSLAISPSGRAGFARAAVCDDRPTRSTEDGADVSPFRGSAAFTEEWKHFDFALGDGVATVTFSRPDKLNALTFDVYADLRDLLSELPHRGDARVLVLTGEGRGFCSGGDVVKSMRDSPLPFVAAVNGVAAGAGAVLALAADFRLLAPTAKFSFLFTRVGLAGADMGAAYLLPRLVGLGRATELLLLGDEVSAERAVELGLASRIADDLPAAAQNLARMLADGPALAYATTKLLLTRELDLDLGGAIEMEALAQALLMKSDDFGEFYAAWSEGRSPAWSGR